jgi:hypothetical protein
MEKLFNFAFNNSFLINEKVEKARLILDDDAYFKIRYFKSQRFENLKKIFRQDTNSSENFNLIIGTNFGFSNWKNIHKYLPKVNSVRFLDKNFFHGEFSESDFTKKYEYLNGKILLLTNHDIVKSNPQSLKNLISLYLKCDNTLFAGWDWDNHHNVHISSIFALCSDIYFPSQRGHEYELTKLAQRNKFIMPSAYEWTNEFLSNHMSVILDTPRVSNIFGVFNYHGKFKYRNQIIQTLNAQIPEIKFIDDFEKYQNKSEIDKLTEWSSYKWHWVIPTLNAVSVRAYYALIAGTGVILPIEFKSLPEFNHIDPRDVIWFTEQDILDARRILSLINENSTKYCKEDILRRHYFVSNSYNLHTRVIEMCDSITEYLR